jgi:transposase InsO family protein
MDLVERQRYEGRTVNEVLGSLGVARSSYYRWRKRSGEQKERRQSTYQITEDERRLIEGVKEAHPEYRHRRIQGALQNQGVYLSASAIYGHLRQTGWVQAYERRAAPWKEPRYEVWQRNLMWGCDWTKLLVGGVRWYLLTVIDFYSRLIVAFDIVPTVHAGHVKAIYQAGLKGQGISVHGDTKPELRVDRGSPNTSWVTQEFFEALGAELSFARVRRPTDNAVTERFYGTVKQEEIYLVGNYPDETSAREEIGRYIETYNRSRPHQALFNFTPARVHEVNNKSMLLQELNELKRRTREKRKAYWAERSNGCQQSAEGGCPGKGHGEIVDPGAYTEEIFDRHQPDFQKTNDEGQK